MQGIAQVRVTFGHVGRQADGLPVGGDGLLQPAAALEEVPEVVMGVPKAGAQCDGGSAERTCDRS